MNGSEDVMGDTVSRGRRSSISFPNSQSTSSLFQSLATNGSNQANPTTNGKAALSREELRERFMRAAKKVVPKKKTIVENLSTYVPLSVLKRLSQLKHNFPAKETMHGAKKLVLGIRSQKGI
eukprot:TRINITY_DN8033_c0_g1_i1.p1 TRINITY_DN8033_c0_g1~~TRINITY_DN8033_c0_g1_i1.p1  ORF type:complete len:122 (-),score=17.59 TRINITY_DN8033_c0_g1_i1:98-463(-)